MSVQVLRVGREQQGHSAIRGVSPRLWRRDDVAADIATYMSARYAPPTASFGYGERFAGLSCSCVTPVTSAALVQLLFRRCLMTLEGPLRVEDTVAAAVVVAFAVVHVAAKARNAIQRRGLQ